MSQDADPPTIKTDEPRHNMKPDALLGDLSLEQRDFEDIRAAAGLMALQSAIPVYTAEIQTLRREKARREMRGEQAGDLKHRLNILEQRNRLYESANLTFAEAPEKSTNLMVITGKVTRHSIGLPDLAVIAYDGSGTPVAPRVPAVTDHKGCFSMKLSQTDRIRLVITDGNNKTLHCYEEEISFEPGTHEVVYISLGHTEPVKVPPEKPGCDDDREPVII